MWKKGVKIGELQASRSAITCFHPTQHSGGKTHTFSIFFILTHFQWEMPWFTALLHTLGCTIPRFLEKKGICKIGTVDILCQNSIEKGLCLAKNYMHATKTYKIVNLFSPGVSLSVTSGSVFSNLCQHDVHSLIWKWIIVRLLCCLLKARRALTHLLCS